MLKALGYREPRPNNDPSKIENVFFGVKGVKNNSTRKNSNSKGLGTFNTLKGWFGLATPGTATPVSEAPTEEVEEAVSVISNNNNSNHKNFNNTIMVNEVEPVEQNAIPAEMPLSTSFNTGMAAMPSANVPSKRRGFITNEELRAARATHTNNTGFGKRLFNTTLRKNNITGGKRKRRSHKRSTRRKRTTKNRRTNRK